LKNNGRVVILDLLAHRFERARELYADHWLGFSEVSCINFLRRTASERSKSASSRARNRVRIFKPSLPRA
jgi:hypothetical protein